MSLARKLSPGLLLAFGEYPDSWMIGGDDRDDAGLELDGWSYPRLEGQGTRQKMLSQTPRRWDQVATHEMRKSARGVPQTKVPTAVIHVGTVGAYGVF